MTRVYFSKKKNPCGHPRHHTEGFYRFPVISIRPEIIQMICFDVLEIESYEELFPHESEYSYGAFGLGEKIAGPNFVLPIFSYPYGEPLTRPPRRGGSRYLKGCWGFPYSEIKLS